MPTHLKSIALIDQNTQLVTAWGEAFRNFEEVKSVQGDYFETPADAMVSPANSFGYMDGGLDGAIRSRLGYGIEQKVREVLLSRHHGELPVGMAEIIETGEPTWPFLICAPTMRVPEPIDRTLNSYLSFRAVLLAVKNHNQDSSKKPITSLICPGMGTGIGKMPPRRCAAQMRAAYYLMQSEPSKLSFSSIHDAHFKMMTS